MTIRRRFYIFVMSLALALGSTVALSATQSAEAYNTTGCRWTSKTVRYWSASSYTDATARAVRRWTNNTNINFNSVGVSNAEVVIANKNFGNTSYDGITYYAICYGGNYDTGGQQTTSYYNTYFTSGYGRTARIQLMVHELGHALGLKHAGSSACSGQPIMYFSSDRYFKCGHIGPQTDDIHGINHVYP